MVEPLGPLINAAESVRVSARRPSSAGPHHRVLSFPSCPSSFPDGEEGWSSGFCSSSSFFSPCEARPTPGNFQPEYAGSFPPLSLYAADVRPRSQTPIRSDPSWASNPSSPLLRPFFTLAAKFTRPTPHVLFLGAFDGSSGGVENYLARRLALGGTRVSVVDVPSGGTRRRIDGLRSSIKLAFAGRSKGEETAEALESIAVLEPDPALPLEAHLAYFLATAYPPVTGVTIFKGNEGPNSTTDGIIQALSKVLTTKSNPWLMVLEFAEDEDRSVSWEETAKGGWS